MTESQKRRLNKLVALFTRGVGGEKLSAERKIRAMCQAYGIHFDDIVCEAEATDQSTIITFHGSFQQRLFWQIIGRLQLSNNPMQHPKGVKNKIRVSQLTRAQAAELEMAWKVWSIALGKHFTDSYTAFVIANEIWDMTKEADSDYEWTEDDQRQYNMARGIQPTPIYQGLEHKS